MFLQFWQEGQKEGEHPFPSVDNIKMNLREMGMLD
jgi:hypothetical protein